MINIHGHFFLQVYILLNCLFCQVFGFISAICGFCVIFSKVWDKADNGEWNCTASWKVRFAVKFMLIKQVIYMLHSLIRLTWLHSHFHLQS